MRIIARLLFYVILICAIVVLILILSMLYESDNYYGFKCKLMGGKIVSNGEVYFPPAKICRIKTKDYERACKDNADCEGVCKIENQETLKQKSMEILGKDYSSIDLREFEEKTREIIGGYCSEFIFDFGSNIEKCSRNEAIYVENGVIKFYTKPQGILPCEDFGS